MLGTSALTAAIPYLAGLDPQAQAEIARAVRRRTVRSGQQILVEGEPCDGLYFVIDGQVRLVKIAPDGREHVVRVLGPGATFNEAAVFDGGPNSDSAVAIGATVVGMLPKAEVARLVDKYPQVGRAALKLRRSPTRARQRYRGPRPARCHRAGGAASSRLPRPP